ncbi:M48 family metallopeptidase [Halomonas sp. LS-001]
MDFFTAQDQARRNTGRLVVLMILAIVALTAVATVAIVIGLHFMNGSSSTPQGGFSVAGITSAFSIELVGVVAVAVLAVVVLGGLFKQHQLGRGGRAVAEALGGREINMNTRDSDERRILNVVEEMAIASGTPVPSVYVMEEDSINAFAAGHRPEDAVIGITRGTIRHLTREELQGVVAHEFSHILHGDMRLNIRLVSVLHGILVIGLLGGMLLRSMRFRRVGRGKRNNSAVVILALGAVLMLVGYAGTFFGNLIKSAVSRQREYLADASAVQYTRNPKGIGNALIKVGAHAQGSRLQAPQAAEFSHLFFGQGMKLSQMMSTHPPVNERIQRIMPDWDGSFELTRMAGDDEKGAATDQDDEQDSRPGPGLGRGPLAAILTAASARTAIASVGQPDERHLEQARARLDALPQRINDAAHEPYSARALMYALLLADDKHERDQQLKTLEQIALPDVYEQLLALAPEVANLNIQLRLPLVELSLPALKSLSLDQTQHFRLCIERLIQVDGKTSLFEWTLHQLLQNNLIDRGSGPANLKLKDLDRECQRLLTVLASAGQDDAEEMHKALAVAAKELPFALHGDAEIDVSDMQALSMAVERLRRLKPMHKPMLLQAMAACIEHNGVVSAAEAELFRATADILDCPMPPLLNDEETTISAD